LSAKQIDRSIALIDQLDKLEDTTELFELLAAGRALST
jgi:hypothetical protein